MRHRSPSLTVGASEGVANLVVQLSLLPITDDLGSCFLQMRRTFDYLDDAHETAASQKRLGDQGLRHIKEYFATGKHASQNLILKK